jgi:spore coat polysaccharide biosynthesis predicted glycosyltransferase SpsG
LRADGGPQIGMGHMVRCGVLADALHEAGAETIWLSRTPDLIPESYAGEVRTLEAEEEVFPSEADLFVGDWKENDPDLTAWLSERAPLCLIGGGSDAPCDLRIRQHYDPVAREPDALSGPDYVILSKAFEVQPRRPAPTGPARGLLVSLGGGRTPVFERVVAALARLPRREEIELEIIGAGDISPLQTAGFAELRRQDRTAEMPALMAAADLAVLAGGTSLHEAAVSGLPAVCLPLAANQAKRAAALERLGLGLCVDPEDSEALITALSGLAEDAKARGEMSARGQALIDGQGARRCAEAILALARPPKP